MGLMATDDERQDRKRDRHKARPLQLRIHPLLRRQLEELVDRNVSTLTAEITIALREHLRANSLWPPPSESEKKGRH